MTSKHLLEAATLASTEPSADGSWTVRLISEGRGSSGVYTRSLLENYFHAFEDVLSFLNHPVEGPHERNFTEIAGRIKNARFQEDSEGRAAIFGDYYPDEQYAEKLGKYRDKLGLSIYISGTGSVEESTGDFIVESFDEDDPFKSVDVVIAPGARGKFMESMQKVYSDRTENKRTAEVAGENRKKNMEKEILDALNGVKDALNALTSEKAEKAATAAKVEADAEAAKVAAESAVSHYSAAVEAVDAADLFESQRKSILAAAAKGEDVSELISEAKAVKEEAVKAVTESASQDDAHGVVLGESATKFGAWA